MRWSNWLSVVLKERADGQREDERRPDDQTTRQEIEYTGQISHRPPKQEQPMSQYLYRRVGASLLCQARTSARAYSSAVSGGFDWTDPLAAKTLLTEDEIAISETAERYAQEQLVPRLEGTSDLSRWRRPHMDHRQEGTTVSLHNLFPLLAPWAQWLQLRIPLHCLFWPPSISRCPHVLPWNPLSLPSHFSRHRTRHRTTGTRHQAQHQNVANLLHRGVPQRAL